MFTTAFSFLLAELAFLWEAAGFALLRFCLEDFETLLYQAIALEDEIRDRIKGRRRLVYLRMDIPPPEQSSWVFIKNCGSNDAVVKFTGFSRRALVRVSRAPCLLRPPVRFYSCKGVRIYFLSVIVLLQLTSALERHVHELDRMTNPGRVRATDRSRPLEDLGEAGGRGGRWKMTVLDILALTLRWFTTRHRHDDLALEFGIVRSSVTRMLGIGRRALLATLRTTRDSRIAIPSAATRDLHADVMCVKYGPSWDPSARPFAVIDGTWMSIMVPGTEAKQRLYYSGKNCDHGINSVFISGPDGCIHDAAFAFPGSFHDQTVAADMLGDWRRILRIGKEHIVGDIGFRAAWLSSFILLPLSNGATIPPGEEGVALKRQSRWLTSLRQGSEWINQSLKQTFLRVSLRLPNQMDRTRLIIETCLRLHNLRARWEKIGQMKTVYAGLMEMRELEVRAAYIEREDEDGINRNDLDAEADPDHDDD